VHRRLVVSRASDAVMRLRLFTGLSHEVAHSLGGPGLLVGRCLCFPWSMVFIMLLLLLIITIIIIGIIITTIVY